MAHLWHAQSAQLQLGPHLQSFSALKFTKVLQHEHPELHWQSLPQGQPGLPHPEVAIVNLKAEKMTQTSKASKQYNIDRQPGR